MRRDDAVDDEPMPPGEREYFYRIDRNGRLFHAGSELADPRFLDFFFRRLGDNDSGRHPDWPYLSRCGGELNFVQAELCPIVFSQLTAAGELIWAADLRLPFVPGRVCHALDGLLWHPAPVGDHGLLASRIALRLGEMICEDSGGYVLAWRGERHRLQPCAPRA